jgi:prophage regulatory protein
MGNMLKRYLRVKEVAKLVSMHRATIARLVARGEFPAPVRVTPSIVAWPETTIAAWQAEMEERRAPRARVDEDSPEMKNAPPVAAGEARY